MKRCVATVDMTGAGLFESRFENVASTRTPLVGVRVSDFQKALSCSRSRNFDLEFLLDNPFMV